MEPKWDERGEGAGSVPVSRLSSRRQDENNQSKGPRLHNRPSISSPWEKNSGFTAHVECLVEGSLLIPPHASVELDILERVTPAHRHRARVGPRAFIWIRPLHSRQKLHHAL